MDGGSRIAKWARPMLASIGSVALVSPAAFGAGGSVSGRPKPTAPTSLAWALPRSAVGRQLAWFVDAAPLAPLPTAEIDRHFDPTFLAQVPPAEINQGLAEFPSASPWRIVALEAGRTASQGLAVDAIAGTARVGVEIATDGRGLIGGLLLGRSPAAPAGPVSWAALDRSVRTLAPHVGFEAATLGSTGRCSPINVVQPSTSRPLGSMFKLYVLGAVAHAVASGHLSWSRSIALAAPLRSLPSGSLQIEPIGTRYSVRQLAELMISSSDNTAADELAALVGRAAVEAQVRSTSDHADQDVPFLRTRELFALKYADYPHHAVDYLAMSTPRRLAYLRDVVDEVPLSAIHTTAQSTAEPRLIDSVEWFASPSDLCAQFAALYRDAGRAALAPVSAALSINDGGLGLSSSRWPLVWFKGGSETGVVTLGYLARSATGQVVIVVVELSNPTRALASEVTLRALGIVNAAFRLARDRQRS